MITKEIWLNLPVKDVARSKEFFTKLGFPLNSGPGDTEHSACMIVGEKQFVVMLFEEKMFKGFTRNELADTNQSSEILISIDAESRDEVDRVTEKAREAGAVIFAEPEEIQGWMYGSGFADPDGHRWNILYMEKKAK